jgi:ketosteroid isomerase-like protein
MSIRLPLALAACLLLLVAVAPRAGGADAASVEREIARLEQGYNDAYGRNDLDPYFAFYADGAVLIFYDNRTTLPKYRTAWTESVRAGNVVAAWKVSDLVIRTSPAADVAIASYRVDAANRYADGKRTEERGFETDVWVKRGAAWKIEHAQYSLAVRPPN